YSSCSPPGGLEGTVRGGREVSGVLAALATAADQAVKFPEELGIVVRAGRAGPGAGRVPLWRRGQIGVGQCAASWVPAEGSLRRRPGKMGHTAWPTCPAHPETDCEQGKEGAQQKHGRSLAVTGPDSSANA